MKKKRHVWIIALVVALTLGLVVAACGDDQKEAKAALSAALDKVEASVATLQQMGAETTVPDIKAALKGVAPVWQEVVTAAKGVKDADVAAAEKAWTDVETAVNGLADDANIMAEAATIMGPVNALRQVEANLRSLVTSDK
jgi:hypothetical protein